MPRVKPHCTWLICDKMLDLLSPACAAGGGGEFVFFVLTQYSIRTRLQCDTKPGSS